MMFKRLIGALAAIVGMVFFLLGILGAPICILAALDPVEAQLSNDPDPYGTPKSSATYLLMSAAYAAGAVAGFFMVRWGKRFGVDAQQGVPADRPRIRSAGG